MVVHVGRKAAIGANHLNKVIKQQIGWPNINEHQCIINEKNNG